MIAKLARLGVPAETSDVLTSALAAAALLAGELPAGATVLTCAGPGVVEALEAVGLQPRRRAPPAAAVVVGFHREFDFDELDRASQAIRDGARFVATNLDATYPIPGGLLPGAGSIAAAIATASGATPEVAGKPSPADGRRWCRSGSAAAASWSGTGRAPTGRSPTMLGWPFALVLSGVTGRGRRRPVARRSPIRRRPSSATTWRPSCLR